ALRELWEHGAGRVDGSAGRARQHKPARRERVSFAIAAAGTGGHVYPGLAVGEALVDLGVSRDEILYIGGQRLEAQVYPEAGFPFLSVELRGLSRQLTLRNLGIPRVVMAAVRTIRAELVARQVKALLGLGGYVTVPAGLAAR